MTLLVLGIAFWWAAHLFKRLLPAQRAALTERMGNASKGVVAGALVLSIILMVVGYKSTDFIPVYTPAPWTVHVNNLMMICAVILFGMGSSRGRARSWLRHPMLLGFLTWTLAHLLVNGDLASVILFGGLGLWVPVSILLINTQEPAWDRPAPGTPKGDLRLVLISVVVFIVITTIHGLIGPSPFPG